MATPKKTTGTSYLPEETIERAQAGTKFEKIKLEKDKVEESNDETDKRGTINDILNLESMNGALSVKLWKVFVVLCPIFL